MDIHRDSLRNDILKLIAARRGKLKAWYAGTYTADVDILGHFPASLKGIKVSKSIPSSEMQVGRFVQVAVFNPTRPIDGVVVAVYT